MSDSKTPDLMAALQASLAPWEALRRERELEAERCECGVVSRGLVNGKCADCRDRESAGHRRPGA